MYTAPLDNESTTAITGCLAKCSKSLRYLMLNKGYPLPSVIYNDRSSASLHNPLRHQEHSASMDLASIQRKYIDSHCTVPLTYLAKMHMRETGSWPVFEGDHQCGDETPRTEPGWVINQSRLRATVFRCCCRRLLAYRMTASTR